jgi:TRAP-type mannitol/chloroaromatic compound transport system permease small subunit
VQSRLSVKQKALIDCLGTLFFLIPFCVMVMFYSWDWIMNSWTIQEVSPDPGGLPRYPIKTLVIISFALLFIQGISEAIKNLAIFRGILEPTIEDRSRRAQE